MTDRITFNCVDCGQPVSIDQSNPPNDDEMISCMGCGREFGKYSVVKDAMIAAAKAEVDKMVTDKFGKPPKWK